MGRPTFCVSCYRQVSRRLRFRIYQCFGTLMEFKMFCSNIEVCCMDTPPGAIWPQTTSPSGLCVSPSKFGNTGVLATKTTQASHRCLEKRHSSRCRSRVELASACTGTRWPPGVQSDPSSSVGCMQDPFTIGCVIGPCT